MRSITLKAHAKINLGLDVLGKREDGYHELRMIMETIGLHDTVTVTLEDEPGIRIASDSSGIPGDSSNLAWKAAELILREAGFASETGAASKAGCSSEAVLPSGTGSSSGAFQAPGVSIYIQKNIPVAAGLAGGSTDAAAVLKGMRTLLGDEAADRGAPFPMSDKWLMEKGLLLGADVPYCIAGGSALAEGIGEKLTPLPKPPECFIALAKPGIDVSTKYVYTHLPDNTDGFRPDISAQIKALENKDLSALAAGMGNVLESVTAKEYPVIDSIKSIFLEEGAKGALMSGSGPTVFGLFTEKEQARKACERAADAAPGTKVAVTNFA